MDRRDFLKTAGLGTVALASIPSLAETAVAGGGGRYSAFVALSKAQTVDGVAHTVVMSGFVQFLPPTQETFTAFGGGNFVHFDNAPTTTPKPVLAFGTWEVLKLLSYTRLDPPGVYGVIEAGILELRIRLTPQQEGAPPPFRAKLRIVCNVGPAGATTGELEGYTLTIPDAPFGPFEPFDPALGLTHISTRGKWGPIP